LHKTRDKVCGKKHQTLSLVLCVSGPDRQYNKKSFNDIESQVGRKWGDDIFAGHRSQRKDPPASNNI